MYQFFVEDNQIQDNRAVILGQDVNHIVNVLRMKSGEKVRISDRKGRAYFGHVDSLSPDQVWIAIDEADETGTELDNEITLYQGLPKGDKMELIIQKAVELGVNRIVPVAMKNCVVKLDEKKSAKKIDRWQAIAESAAKQSKRSIIPMIEMPKPYKMAIQEALSLDRVLLPYENERGMEATRETVRQIERGDSVGIFIGPEGGFAPDEIDFAKEFDKVRTISLGRRILRTETAGMATLAMLVYELDR